jgi:hypothetical protein
MAGTQNVQGINAIAIARGKEEPSNRNVLWLDENITGSFYKIIKCFNLESGKWELLSRSNLELLSDLKTVDGKGSGLDADTIQGLTPEELLGDNAIPNLSTGQIIAGQADTIGVAKTVGGVVTMDADGNFAYTPNSISHTGLSDIGTNTHAQIDTHISNASNPHSVTASQVGNTLPQWNANSIEGNLTNLGTLGVGQDGYSITWDNATSRFITTSVDSIYNSDGELSGNRIISGGGTKSLSLGDNVLNENLGYIKTNSTQGLEQFSSVFPITSAGLEVIKNPANFIANVKSSATDYSQFRLQSDEFIVNSFLGTNNYMHSSTPALSSTIISDGGAGTNSRLLLYGSGRVDLGTTGSVGAYITLDTSNTFTDRNTTPKGLEYTLDYSANFTNRSLVDKEYVDNNAGGDSIYTADGTLTGNRTVDLDGNDLSFEGNSGLNIDNTAVNNNKALLSLSKGMSNSETRSTFIEGIQNGSTNNYWKIYQKGSSNFMNNNGIGFYRNNTASQGTEYGMTGISAINSALYIANYTDSTPRMTLYGGTTNVTGNGYLKFWDYNASTQRIQIARSGTNFINPDTRTGGVAGLIVMGDTYVGTEKISLQGSTLIKGNGTSTGSTLALYNNDTTPVKTWDFLDNGNVNLGVDSTVDLDSNKLTFDAGNSTDGGVVVDGSNYTGNQDPVFTVLGQVNSSFRINEKGFITNSEIEDNNILKLETSNNSFNLIHEAGIFSSKASSFKFIHPTFTTNYVEIDASRTRMKFFFLGNAVHDIMAEFDTNFYQSGFSSNKWISFGSSSRISTEDISLQGDTLIDGSLDMNNNRITNTIVNPSVQETTSTATFTINVDEETTGVLTAIALATTIASPTGTPVQSQNLIFRFKDNGTARALTWNAIFRAIGITLPTTTTANKLLYVGCKYNSTDTKWDVVSVQEEA